MKNKALKVIRFTSLLLVLLLFLPTFSLWAVEAPEGEAAETAAEVQAQNESLSAALSASMEEESMLFHYVDRASFIEAGHIERVVEDEELNTYVFKNPNGSKTMYFLGEDVKYLNAQGVQQEKRLDLVALDSGYTTRSSDLSLALPDSIAKGVTLAYNDHSVTLTPKPQTLTGGTVSAGSALTGAAGASLTADLEATLMEQALQIAPVGISTGKADYQGVFGTGTTLRYTPTLSGVKEDVILDAYRGQNTFAFTLNTGSLSVFEENGQYFIAESAESEEKILISETWVYDSADHFEKGNLTVTPVKAGLYLLTVGASVDFLTDSKTVYPVYIDPTLTVNSGNDYIEDVTVYSGYPDNNYGNQNTITVGKHANTSYGTGRTAIRLTGLYESDIYQQIIDSQITSVKFSMKGASSVSTASTAYLYPLTTTSWTESEANWSNLAQSASTVALASAPMVSNTLSEFDITSLVWDWKGNDSGTLPARPYYQEQGFMLVSSNETVQKRFYSSEVSSANSKPYITLTYTSVVLINGGDTHTIYGGLNETLQLEAQTYPANLPVTWSVNNTDVATIDTNTGLLTGVSLGTVTITATGTNEDGTTFSDTATVQILPIKPGGYYFINKEYSRGLIIYEDSSNIVQVGDPIGLEENVCSPGEEISILPQYLHDANTWIINYHSDGYYTIKYKTEFSNSLNLYLGYSEDSSTTVLVSSTNDFSKWIIERLENGCYKLVPYPYANTENCLVVARTETVLGEYTTINFLSSVGSYTNDSLKNDEWEISPAKVTIVNYYDSSIAGNSELIHDIIAANQFVSTVLEDFCDLQIIFTTPLQFQDYVADQCSAGVDQPCNASCGTCDDQEGGYLESTGSVCWHHKNIKRISRQLSEMCQDNQAIIMWSNRAEGTYCVEEKHTAGEYVTQNGVTYFGYPGIQIFLEKIDFEVFDDNEYRVAYMAVCLLHELGHYYGLSEKYNLTSHDDQTNLTCVMKRIGAMYGSANSVVSSLSTVEKLQNVKLFYEEIMNSTENLFCTECKDTVKANCHTYKYIGGLRDEE